ncbi:MAG: hypothetical protein ACK55I_11485, partial [bacterium]
MVEVAIGRTGRDIAGVGDVVEVAVGNGAIRNFAYIEREVGIAIGCTTGDLIPVIVAVLIAVKNRP